MKNKMNFYVVRFSYDSLDNPYPFFESMQIYAKSKKERELLLSLYHDEGPFGGPPIPQDRLTYFIENREIEIIFENGELN